MKAHEEMEMWVGRYIAHWAYIDEKLFDICLIALGAKQQQTAIVFYKTPTLDARLSLVGELLEAFLPIKPPGEPDPLRKTWDNLSKRVRKYLPFRNALAHHPITEITIYDTDKDGAHKRMLSVRPGIRQRYRGKAGKADRVDADDLPGHLEDIIDLDLKLRMFERQLREIAAQKSDLNRVGS
jgi:hypothetical protein